MASEEILAVLRADSREGLYRVWQHVKRGQPLSSPDDVRLGRVLQRHREYRRFWDRARRWRHRDVMDETGANPYLHVMFHVVLEAQRESGEIREVEEALSGLRQRGVAEHEAEHTVLNVLVRETWHVLHEGRPFDLESYRRGLKALVEGG